MTNHFGVYDDMRANYIIAALFIIFPIIVYCSQFFKHQHFISFSKNLGLITYPLYLLHQKIGSVLLGSTFGKVSLTSVCVVIIMLFVSHLIGVKEAILRKYISSRLKQLLGLNSKKGESLS
jgi:peptidoglycan/LPS O-acetylase OafA/YrhL